MTRQTLESLIAFALHLGTGLNDTSEHRDVARDALELSRLAKRLHYLDERYAFTLSDQKVDQMLGRAHALLMPYGYYPYPFHETRPKGLSLRLATAPFGYKDSDLTVPY